MPVPLFLRGDSISIHALREEGDVAGSDVGVSIAVISIHALREEGDVAGSVTAGKPVVISIHALREEGDTPTVSMKYAGN